MLAPFAATLLDDALPLCYELEGLYLLDVGLQGLRGVIGAYLLPGNDSTFALIECGPRSSLPMLQAAIIEAGFAPENLREVLVTHIHLDHAGAAATLARRYGATVYAERSAAPHLVEPSRLLASAHRVFGDALEDLWGLPQPLPEAQLKTVQGGDVLKIRGHTLEVIATPGHAGSHVAYLLAGERLFTGDALGIRVPGAACLRPAVPPPEIDLERWETTLRQLAALPLKSLLLTHFGQYHDVAAHIDALLDLQQAWGQDILQGLQKHEDDAALTARIARASERLWQQAEATELGKLRHERSSTHAMSASGLKRYWQKHHPELLP